MGTRRYIAWVAALAVALGTTHAASADPKSDAIAKSKDAMASYDEMDFEAAKKQLDQALAIAKKAKLDKDPVTAKIHLNIGITALAAGDRDAAAAAFRAAVQIDAKIQVPAGYRSPAITALLDQARADAKSAPAPAEPPPGPPGLDCSTVQGLQHTIIDSGTAGRAEPIEALVGADVTPAKVVVMYRPEGGTSFTEARLAKQGACKYTGAIPAAAKRGSLIHYYVAAYDENNRVIAGKGSASSPNIMELAGGTPGDGEDPINGRSGGRVSGGVIAGGKPAKVYIGVAGGSGLGFVSGTTEFNNKVENCCIGSSLVVITPELGYYASRKLSIGVAARLGLPIGANIEGHSSLAPSGLVRVRYALSASGEGIRVMGQVGAGVLLNTIKLDNAGAAMDTDIVAQGPLLVGAGIGYMKRLTGGLAFIADLSALGAIAVADKLGSARNLNHGLAADLSIGLAFGF